MNQPKPPNPTSAKPPLPPTVQRAVLFMRTGAALTVANGLIMLVHAAQVQASIPAADSSSPTNTTAYDVGSASGFLAWYGIITGLWLWMAQANKSGKDWARITGTVFFGISCLIVLLSLAVDTLAGVGPGGAVVLLALATTCLSWITGLFTVILLWHKKSAPYFRPGFAPTLSPVPSPYAAYGPNHHRSVPQSTATMQSLAQAAPQNQPPTDPWSTPNSQA